MNPDACLRVPGVSDDRLNRIVAGKPTLLDAFWLDPTMALPNADPWQREVLSNPFRDWMLCCSRQSGKTETVTAQCSWEVQACGSFVLVLSASENQAYEFMDRFYRTYDALRLVEPAEPRTKSQLRLANGGRILALPNNERTVRVYSSVGRLVIDEASRVPDQLYSAVTPMLAVAKGRQTLLSTPFGKRGFFWDEWSDGGDKWNRAIIPWYLCPRIPEKFIEDETRKHGEKWVAQEYECEFADSISGVFDVEGFKSLIEDSINVQEYFQW